MDESWGTESPGVAEDWLSLAVQGSEVWCVLGCEEHRNGLVPLVVGVVAKSVAGLVTASNVHHPFLDAWAGSRAVASKDILVVLEGDLFDRAVRDGSRTSIDWVDDRRGWNRRRDRGGCASNLSQQAVELTLELIEDRDLVRDSKCWQRQDEWCDAHFLELFVSDLSRLRERRRGRVKRARLVWRSVER